ncbi:MAG: carboxymuconolactone decarboxylase family protein, partial [Candidatus Hydrogenedentes bacterium]|nr:carboxymuconolactone decarboxylase family protein [Candidatus Hydrogenedentota bacterium]
MSRLRIVDPQKVDGKVKPLLDAVQKKMGATPNIMRAMANSPAALGAYLGFSGALADSGLGL